MIYTLLVTAGMLMGLVLGGLYSNWRESQRLIRRINRKFGETFKR